MEISAVSLSEFAVLVGVSEPTLRKRFAAAGDEAPIGKRGKNGEAYEIPIPAALEWWKAQQAAAEAEDVARREALRGLQMDLLGDDRVLDAASAGLSATEQAAQLEAEIKAIKLGQMKAELVRAEDVERVAAAFMALVADRMNTLATRLRNRTDLPADVMAVLERMVQRDLHDLADAALKIGERSLAEERVTGDPPVPAGG